MSSYPPTPSFNPSFDLAAPHHATAARGPRGGLRRSQVLSRAQEQRAQAAEKVCSAAAAAPVAVAADAFRQDPGPPSFNLQNMPHIGPGMPPILLGAPQWAIAGLPPPPHPPVPIPPNGFPLPFPPNLHLALTNGSSSAAQPQSLPPPPPLPMPAAPAVKTVSHNPAVTQSRDREEGELTDGDMEEERFSLGRVHGSFTSQPVNAGHADAARRSGGHDSGRSQLQRRPSPVYDFRQSQELSRRPSAKSGPPPSPAKSAHGPHAYSPTDAAAGQIARWTREREGHDNRPPRRESKVPTPHPHDPGRAIAPLKRTPSMTQTDDEDLRRLAESQRPTPNIGKSTAELRKLAKNAILKLYPLQIRFPEFVAEGIREDVVKGLFEELRLSYPVANDTRRPPQEIGRAQVPPEYIGKGSIEQSDKSTPVPLKPLVAASSDTTVAPQTTELDSPATSPLVGKGSSQGSKKPPEASLRPMFKAPTLTSLSTGSFNQPIKSSQGAPAKIERKDLIAQKMAARSGRGSLGAAQAQLAPAEESSERTAEPLQAPPKTQPFDGHGRLNAVPSSTTLASPEALQSSAAGQHDLPATIRPVLASADNSTARVRQKLASLQAAEPTRTIQEPAGDSVVERRGSSRGRVVDSKEHHKAHIADLKPSSDPPQEATADARNRIPGLLMTPLPTSDAALPGSNVPEINSPDEQRPNRRKRPVAADFNTEPTPLPGSFKRPFGHSRVDQPLVIDVSDDEYADDNDSIDEDKNMIVEGDQQALANDVHGSLRRTAMRDMPPLPDFPTLKNALIRKANGQPKSGLNTPPASQPVGGSKGNAQEDLKRKEEQIQLMQKRIAELEHRKAKQNGSRAHTPATAHRPQTLVQGSAHPHSSKQVETAMEIDRLIHDTHRQVEENKMALAEAKAAEVRAGAEEAANTQSADPDGLHLKHAEAHLIRQRRAELRSSLQESTSKVELEKKRLAELRKEQEERESLMCQALETKTKLVEELESLGFEASEELCEELEATRKENRGLAKPVTSGEAGQLATGPAASRGFSSATSADFFPRGGSVEMQPPDAAVSYQDLESNGHAPTSISPSPRKSAALSHGRLEQRSLQAAEEYDGQIGELQHASEEREDPVLSVEATRDKEMPQTSDEITEEGEIADGDQTAVEHTEHLGKMGSLDGATTDGATPIAESNVSSAVSTADVVMADAADSEPQPVTDADRTGDLARVHIPRTDAVPSPSAWLEVTETTSSEVDNGSSPSDDSDSYEPPEATPEAQEKVPSQSTALSNAPPPDSPSFSPISVEVAVSPEAAPATTDAINAPAPGSESKTLPSLMSDVAVDRVVKVTRTPQQDHFKPYESLLKRFRSFRYHPDFLAQVSDGFRSLTYSPIIDANREICRFEASGGVCNDDACDGQHFRNMKSSDDKLLIQMGSVVEGSTPEQREAYKAGLRRALQELDRAEVKDFSTVAARMASYRSEFLQDASRVLVLDGQSRQ